MESLLEALKNNRLYADCALQNERRGNYEKQAGVAAKWLPLKETRSGSANLEGALFFDGRFTLVEARARDFAKGLPLFAVISAPLGFYRLMCLFEAAPLVENGYKTMLAFPLYHVASGNYLEFNDYKGAFSVKTQFNEAVELPPDFAADLPELLNFLVSDEVAHPYDGKTAGFMA
jgi:hypothetical protein